jgi:hypothetical protein
MGRPRKADALTNAQRQARWRGKHNEVRRARARTRAAVGRDWRQFARAAKVLLRGLTPRPTAGLLDRLIDNWPHLTPEEKRLLTNARSAKPFRFYLSDRDGDQPLRPNTR